MSHDRGCFRCFDDRWDWKYCQRSDCPNKEKPAAKKKPRVRVKAKGVKV